MASFSVKAAANLSRSASSSFFKSGGVGELAAVGQFAARVELRVCAGAVAHGLLGAPAADGVVVVEGQAERIDLAMAGGAVGVVAMRLQLCPQRGFGLVRRRWS